MSNDENPFGDPDEIEEHSHPVIGECHDCGDLAYVKMELGEDNWQPFCWACAYNRAN